MTHAKLGLDANGKFTALKVETYANMGAYLSTFASSVPTYLYATLPGRRIYRSDLRQCRGDLHQHRSSGRLSPGAGRERPIFWSRIVDRAARETGVDPVELRRRNMIAPGRLPTRRQLRWPMTAGTTRRPGRCPEACRRRRLHRGAQGSFGGQGQKHLASGYSTYIGACSIAPGRLPARSGPGRALWGVSRGPGASDRLDDLHWLRTAMARSHETTFAQLVSSSWGSRSRMSGSHGDTGNVQFGMGTYGSRSLAVGGEALIGPPAKSSPRPRGIHGPSSLPDFGRRYRVQGRQVHGRRHRQVDGVRQRSRAAAYVTQLPARDVGARAGQRPFYDPANFTFPGGTHICEVEVDPETGVVECRTSPPSMISAGSSTPMIVEGQVHGGVAPGHRPGAAGRLLL